MSSKHWIDLGPVFVRLYTGEVRKYANLDEAVRQSNYRLLHHRRQDGRLVITDGVSWYSDRYFSDHGACELRDELGFLIPETVVGAAIDRLGVRYRPRRRKPTVHAAYRRPKGGHERAENDVDPAWRRKVPRNRRRRHIGGQRALEALVRDDDLSELRIRVKRRERCVFDPWEDDRDRGNYHDQGWKRHRLAQFNRQSQIATAS